MLLCFRSSSCCRIQAETHGLKFSCRILWLRADFIVPSNTASRPGTETAQEHQTITLLPPCLSGGDALFLKCRAFWARWNEINTESVTFVSSVHWIISWMSWGSSRRFIFCTFEMSLCFFVFVGVTVGFCFKSLLWGTFLPSACFFLLDHDLWPFSEVDESCRTLDVVLVFLEVPRCVADALFESFWFATPGKVHHWSMLPPYVENDSVWVISWFHRFDCNQPGV